VHKFLFFLFFFFFTFFGHLDFFVFFLCCQHVGNRRRALRLLLLVVHVCAHGTMMSVLLEVIGAQIFSRIFK
jgi:hypothetical protein